MNGVEETRNESAIPEDLEKRTTVDDDETETLKVEMIYKPNNADSHGKKVNFLSFGIISCGI